MTTALAIDGLRLRRGTRDVLCDVTFDVRPNEIVAVMGLSGSGKTTILRAIAGLELFDAGRMRIGALSLDAGAASQSSASRAIRRQVGMVFQFHHLFEHLTALENVCLAPVHVQRVTREAAQTRARQLLDELGVGDRATALPRELSGGEA